MLSKFIFEKISGWQPRYLTITKQYFTSLKGPIRIFSPTGVGFGNFAVVETIINRICELGYKGSFNIYTLNGMMQLSAIFGQPYNAFSQNFTLPQENPVTIEVWHYVPDVVADLAIYCAEYDQRSDGFNRALLNSRQWIYLNPFNGSLKHIFYKVPHAATTGYFSDSASLIPYRIAPLTPEIVEHALNNFNENYPPHSKLFNYCMSRVTKNEAKIWPLYGLTRYLANPANAIENLISAGNYVHQQLHPNQPLFVFLINELGSHTTAQLEKFCDTQRFCTFVEGLTATPSSLAGKKVFIINMGTVFPQALIRLLLENSYYAPTYEGEGFKSLIYDAKITALPCPKYCSNTPSMYENQDYLELMAKIIVTKKDNRPRSDYCRLSFIVGRMLEGPDLAEVVLSNVQQGFLQGFCEQIVALIIKQWQLPAFWTVILSSLITAPLRWLLIDANLMNTFFISTGFLLLQTTRLYWMQCWPSNKLLKLPLESLFFTAFSLSSMLAAEPEMIVLYVLLFMTTMLARWAGEKTVTYTSKQCHSLFFEQPARPGISGTAIEKKLS